jgi:hypothetical protein
MIRQCQGKAGEIAVLCDCHVEILHFIINSFFNDSFFNDLTNGKK